MNLDLRSSAITWLRAEGLAAFVLSIALFSQTELGWGPFLLLLLAPDLSMVGYLGGPRAGAAAYNLAHTYASPALLGGIAHLSDRPVILSLALIWSAHIGLDRALGYGLKLSTGFHHTHLGPIGRNAAASRA